MSSKKVFEALNQQVNAEMFSAYLYLSMSAYFERNNLKGFAHWMNLQANEEMVHAMKIYNFIHDCDGEVKLLPIEGPQTNWSSPLKVFQDALAHEKKVTKMIHDLLTLAIQEHDHATQVFLQWFVTEQVEEEATAKDIVTKLEWVGQDKSALLFLDSELGRRSSAAEGEE